MRCDALGLLFNYCLLWKDFYAMTRRDCPLLGTCERGDRKRGTTARAGKVDIFITVVYIWSIEFAENSAKRWGS